MRPSVNGGSQHWPHVKQPFRSWPNSRRAHAGREEAVRLASRQGRLSGLARGVSRYATRKVLRWIDLRVPGAAAGHGPMGLVASPVNTAIYPRSYLVVLNEYANFATVIELGPTRSSAILKPAFTARI